MSASSTWSHCQGWEGGLGTGVSLAKLRPPGHPPTPPPPHPGVRTLTLRSGQADGESGWEQTLRLSLGRKWAKFQPARFLRPLFCSHQSSLGQARQAWRWSSFLPAPESQGRSSRSPWVMKTSLLVPSSCLDTGTCCRLGQFLGIRARQHQGIRELLPLANTCALQKSPGLPRGE